MAPPGSDPATLARIAVVGLGDIGTAIAPTLAEAGHPVVLASRRTRAELATTDLASLVAHPRPRRRR